MEGISQPYQLNNDLIGKLKKKPKTNAGDPPLEKTPCKKSKKKLIYGRGHPVAGMAASLKRGWAV